MAAAPPELLAMALVAVLAPAPLMGEAEHLAALVAIAAERANEGGFASWFLLFCASCMWRWPGEGRAAAGVARGARGRGNGQPRHL